MTCTCTVVQSTYPLSTVLVVDFVDSVQHPDSLRGVAYVRLPGACLFFRAAGGFARCELLIRARARVPYSNGHVRTTQPKPKGHSYSEQEHTRSMAT